MLLKLSQGQQYLIVSLPCPPYISLTMFRVLKNADSQLKYIIEVVSGRVTALCLHPQQAHK